MKRFTLSLFGFIALVAPLPAEDWPAFRGPRAEAISDAKELPTKWSKTENIRWKTELPGRGISSPVIAGGRVYLTAVSGFEQSRLHVLAFDADSGKKLWERQIWATHYTNCHPASNMAANTGVADGANFYALFGTGDLIAFDKDGNLQWYRSLGKDYPAITNQVGMASSLALWKNILFVPLENAGDSFVAGLDTKKGENLWKVARPKNVNWVTPLVVNTPDHVEVVFQSNEDVSSYDPQTGKLLWKHEMPNPNPIPSLLYTHGTVFAPGKEYTAFRPGQGSKATEELWTNNKIQSGFTSPLYYKERIYYLGGSSVLNAINPKDGTSLEQLRIQGKKFWASPVVGAGKMYLISEEGVTTVVELGEQMKIVATNELEDTIMATPALVNGAFYIRSDKYLYCIGEKNRK